MKQDDPNHRQRQEISHLEGCSSSEGGGGKQCMLDLADLLRIASILDDRIHRWEEEDLGRAQPIGSNPLGVNTQKTLARVLATMRSYAPHLTYIPRKGGR